MKQQRLMYSRSTLPIDKVRQPPGVLIQVQLQLAFFVDDQLRSGKQLAGALALVLIVELQHASSQIKGLSLAIGPCLTESDLSSSGKDNLSSRRRRRHHDVGAVVTQGASDLEVTYSLHFRKRVRQPLVLPLL